MRRRRTALSAIWRTCTPRPGGWPRNTSIAASTGAEMRRPAPLSPPASAPPAPPPLPFTYLGRKLDGGRWEVWLAAGDQTYYVREGSVVERDWAVNAIRPPWLTLTYLPLKTMQTMTIGEAG